MSAVDCGTDVLCGSFPNSPVSLHVKRCRTPALTWRWRCEVGRRRTTLNNRVSSQLSTQPAIRKIPPFSKVGLWRVRATAVPGQPPLAKTESGRSPRTPRMRKWRFATQNPYILLGRQRRSGSGRPADDCIPCTDSSSSGITIPLI